MSRRHNFLLVFCYFINIPRNVFRVPVKIHQTNKIALTYTISHGIHNWSAKIAITGWQFFLNHGRGPKTKAAILSDLFYYFLPTVYVRHCCRSFHVEMSWHCCTTTDPHRCLIRLVTIGSTVVSLT